MAEWQVQAIRMVVLDRDGQEIVVDFPNVNGRVTVEQEPFTDSAFGPMATVHKNDYPPKRLVFSEPFFVNPSQDGREYTVFGPTFVERLRPRHP